MGLLLHALKQSAKGATITLGSTVVSCALAIQIEKSTNRLFFWMAPHWYADVDQAYGITQEQLDSVRHLSRHPQLLAITDGDSTTTMTTNTAESTSSVPAHEVSFSEATVFNATTEEQPNQMDGKIRWFAADFVEANKKVNKKVVVTIPPSVDVMSSALCG